MSATMPTVELSDGERLEHSRRRRDWRASVAMVPAIGMSLLPKVACPACWPAYAGFLGSVGLGFLIDTTYLLPLTGLFLAFAVGALGFHARRRRGLGPLVLGIVASTVVLGGKFGVDSDWAMYAGLTVLVGASVWNSWPIKNIGACQSCAPCWHHARGQR